MKRLKKVKEKSFLIILMQVMLMEFPEKNIRTDKPNTLGILLIKLQIFPLIGAVGPLVLQDHLHRSDTFARWAARGMQGPSTEKISWKMFFPLSLGSRKASNPRADVNTTVGRTC